MRAAERVHCGFADRGMQHTPCTPLLTRTNRAIHAVLCSDFCWLLQVIFMTSWAPSAATPKAAERGSATVSFHDMAAELAKRGAVAGSVGDDEAAGSDDSSSSSVEDDSKK